MDPFGRPPTEEEGRKRKNGTGGEGLLKCENSVKKAFGGQAQPQLSGGAGEDEKVGLQGRSQVKKARGGGFSSGS